MPRNNSDFVQSALYHGTDHPFKAGDVISPSFDAWQGGEVHASNSPTAASYFGAHVYEVEPLEDGEPEMVADHGEDGQHWVSRKGFKVKGPMYD